MGDERMTDKKQDKCPRCDGTRYIPYGKRGLLGQKCPDCQGTGKKPSKQEKPVSGFKSLTNCSPAPKEPSEQDKRELEYVLGSKEPDKWKTSMCRCRLPVKDIPCSVDTFDCVGGCVRTVELWEVQERFDALTQKVKDLEAELKGIQERVIEREAWEDIREYILNGDAPTKPDPATLKKR